MADDPYRLERKLRKLIGELESKIVMLGLTEDEFKSFIREYGGVLLFHDNHGSVYPLLGRYLYFNSKYTTNNKIRIVTSLIRSIGKEEF